MKENVFTVCVGNRRFSAQGSEYMHIQIHYLQYICSLDIFKAEIHIFWDIREILQYEIGAV